MYILWNRILLPLILILAIIIAFMLIFFTFAVLETLVIAKIQEWKVRRLVRKTVKENCDLLEKNIDDMFDGMIDILMLGKEEADVKTKEILNERKNKK